METVPRTLNNISYSSGPIFSNSNSDVRIISSIKRVRLAHGIIMSIVFLSLKPGGAILLRVVPSRVAFRVHVWWQTCVWFLAVGGVGMGIWLAFVLHRYGYAHSTVGLVVAGLFTLQPILGWIHHVRFLRVRYRTWQGFVHVWNGRLAILLGIINGGLGLQAADNTIKGEWAYGVIALASFLSYIGIMIAKAAQGRKKLSRRRKEEETGRVEGDDNGVGMLPMGKESK